MDLKDMLNSKVGRRVVLKSSLVGGGTALAGSWFGSLMPSVAWGADVTAKYETAIVETASGKLRGVIQQGVHTFRGVPYGASTAGSNRFMAPRKPEPWTGVRDAFQNGPTAPQLGGAPNPLILGHTAPSFESEDCLVVNVFTPGLSGKRPVMVWLHGGGYARGAGSAHSFDGNYLARAGDVVVVSVNHRLNVFGYLYLGGIGERYADSGNAGMLDVVAALQWTHENIAHFGGDPGNVTLFGQSGGGAKVSTLLGMPATKGLVHKAIIESGSALKGVSRENADKTAERLLAKLNLQPNQVEELQKLPMEKLIAATDTRG
jgi:para-nitrobenzyl esterase